MKNADLLTCKGICKRFGTTIALNEVDLSLQPGDIRGLIGENGSGKSTLSSIIAGVQKADSGEVFVDGVRFAPKNMLDAQDHDISMVVQETGTIPSVSVAANIFIGKENRFSKAGIMNLGKMMQEASQALSRIGVNDIRPEMPIDMLNFEDRKLIEIARAIENDPKVLIIDETTTALSQRGRKILYSIIRERAQAGNCVLFITHDMDELMEVCNTVTILRDGKLIANLSAEEMEINKMRNLMVGRELNDNYYRTDFNSSYGEEVVLSGRHISVGRMVENFDFDLHKGEILGIGGLTDSGMHDIGRAVFGAEKLLTGEVKIGNETIHTSSQAIRLGIGYVPKNRDTDSVIVDDSIANNIVLPALDRLSRFSYIAPRSEKDLSERGIRELSIKCRDGSQNVRDLSGGNRQKVAVSKWIVNDTQIFILDCPTRGIDIGVKAQIYQLIYKLKTEGKAVMMISEELTELIGMCDRIIIIKDGKMSGEFFRSAGLCENDIIHYMI